MPLIDVVLADQDALLPWPHSPGRFAPQGVFRVETGYPFWAQCLADGSVIPAPADDVPAAAAKPAEPRPAARQSVKV